MDRHAGVCGADNADLINRNYPECSLGDTQTGSSRCSSIAGESSSGEKEQPSGS